MFPSGNEVPMHDLSAMAVFAAIVEAEGFSQAAERLGVSKSSVSKQLARLEERLGARLVNRTTRQLSLTEAGEVYYGYCARILEEADTAEAAVAKLQGAPRGRLRVNAPMSFGTLHLAPAVSAFLCEYPEITIELELTDSFVDLVDSGIDVAIRISQLKDSSLIARRIAPARGVLTASPDYLSKHGTPKHPRDLARHRCLIYTNAPQHMTWSFEGPEGPVHVPVDGPLHSNNGEVLREAAIAGAGILRDPNFISYTAIRSGKLVPVLADYPRQGQPEIAAVYPHRRHLSPKVRAFVDYIAGYFGDPPYWDRHL